MLDMLIPMLMSFLLGPGAGQLYNREIRKGIFLIVFSIVLFAAWMTWFQAAAKPYLPSDLANLSSATFIERALADDASNPTGKSQMTVAGEAYSRYYHEMSAVMAKVSADHGGVMYTYLFLMSLTWVYGVFDALKGGQRRMWMRRLAKLKP